MRRLVTGSALTVAWLAAMAMTAVAGGSIPVLEDFRRPGQIVMSPAAVVEPDLAGVQVAVDEPDSPPDETRSSRDPGASDPPPGRFDNLWLVIVGFVGLLLVVQVVRVDRSGRRPSNGPDDVDS